MDNPSIHPAHSDPARTKDAALRVGQPLSGGPNRIRRMKLKHLVNSPAHADGRLVVRFGEAALIRQRNGRYQLSGGSRSEETEAKEWISLFLHEAVLQTESGNRLGFERG